VLIRQFGRHTTNIPGFHPRHLIRSKSPVYMRALLVKGL